jgi:PPM family protein phosphatase
MPLKLKAVGKTDKGLVRKGNEDFFLVDSLHNVFVVCDGMGGHQAGEVASMTAVNIIQHTFSFFSDDLIKDPLLKLTRSIPERGDLLVKATNLANRAIFNMASQNKELSGMGTTIVALSFESDIVSIAHVGDSRAYKMGERALIPLTSDHSWVNEVQNTQNISHEEASTIISRNIITRALGVKATVDVDYRIAKIQPGDMYILCSDGLCGFADDDEIFAVAHKFRADINIMADNLIQMANDRGGSDNVTILVVQVADISASPLPEIAPITLSYGSDQKLEVIDNWLKKIDDSQEALTNQKQNHDEKHPNKTVLIIMFALFAIAAITIIVFATKG